MKLASRLVKMEDRVERETAQRLASQKHERSIANRPVWQAVVLEKSGAEALRTLAGSCIYVEWGVGRIPDEHDIEKALLHLAERYTFHAKQMGYALRSREDDEEDEERVAMLPIDNTDFNRALHRFAKVGVSNLALVQRYFNACHSRGKAGDRENEFHAATAALHARLDPFLEQERRDGRRAPRRRQQHSTTEEGSCTSR